MNAIEAMAALKEGNRRFVENRLLQPHRTAERRAEISAGQHPFAAVLTCSDSRVVPEILFDQGLGDLFVVRVAGNVADDAVRESLEYGAGYLQIPLIVILGHTRCGAITAAVSDDAHHHAGARTLTSLLRPAVEAARGEKSDRVTTALLANVRATVEMLRRSVEASTDGGTHGPLRIVGAVYDTVAGSVEWLED